MKSIIENRRIVIILDEFDELPSDLIRASTLSLPFFQTLRAISSQAGFILVGGEKMALIMEHHADKLNKWHVQRVDYFSPESVLSDYRQLIQQPTQDALEFRDDAIHELYGVTAGNPYFTKLICQRIFRDAIDRRDCDITSVEVERGIDGTVISSERNTFQHFWQDGILQTWADSDEKSVRRRKVLIALADILGRGEIGTLTKLSGEPLCRDLLMLDADLQDFVARGIVTVDRHTGGYNFKVPLFYRWLRTKGVHDLIVTFGDTEGILAERERQERLRVSAQELVDVVGKWGLYRGQEVTTARACRQLRMMAVAAK